MKRLLLFAAIIPLAANAAPFCAVTGAGTQCNYFSLSACQQAIRGMDGACVANVQQSPQIQQPQLPPPRSNYAYPAPPRQSGMSIFEAGRQGQEDGLRSRLRRLVRDVWDAPADKQQKMLNEIASLDFDTYTKVEQELRRRAESTEATPTVIYRCGDGESATYSKTPAPGCVVIQVGP